MPNSINQNKGLDFINEYLKSIGINKTITNNDVISIFDKLEKNDDGTIDTSIFALAVANEYSEEKLSSVEDDFLDAWRKISSFDKNEASISMDDIQNLNSTNELDNASENEESSVSNNNSSGGGGGSGSSNGTGSSGRVASNGNTLNLNTAPKSNIAAATLSGDETVEELQASRSDALSQLSEIQSQKDNNEFVLAAEQDVQDAKASYDETIEEFEKNEAELYKKISDIQSRKEENDAAISEQKGVVDSVKSQISSKESEISSLVEPPQTIEETDPKTGETVSKPNPEYQAYLAEKARLESELTDLQNDLADEESKLTELEDKGLQIDVELAEIFNTQEMQENQYAKASADAFMAYIEAQANLSTVKTEQTAQLDADISQLRKNVNIFDKAIDKAEGKEVDDEDTSSSTKESDMTLEEFLDSIEDKQTRDFYERLYEMYDFDEFNNRSDIPQYFQTLYTNAFSKGTIRSAGCGITSLAMIASYLTGEEITPDMLTNNYLGDNPASAMHAGIKNLGLNLTTYEGWGNATQDMNGDGTNNLDAALDAGKPVIARMGSDSIFTSGGHFIVIAGKTSDGKYIVNDPNLENYYNPSMVDGFTNGFTRSQITNGLNGIYILEN